MRKFTGILYQHRLQARVRSTMHCRMKKGPAYINKSLQMLYSTLNDWSLLLLSALYQVVTSMILNRSMENLSFTICRYLPKRYIALALPQGITDIRFKTCNYSTQHWINIFWICKLSTPTVGFCIDSLASLNRSQASQSFLTVFHLGWAARTEPRVKGLTRDLQTIFSWIDQRSGQY